MLPLLCSVSKWYAIDYTPFEPKSVGWNDVTFTINYVKLHNPTAADRRTSNMVFGRR